MLKRTIDLRDTKERRKAIRRHALADTIFDCFWSWIAWAVFLIVVQFALYYFGFYSWIDHISNGKENTLQPFPIFIITAILYVVLCIYDFILRYKQNIEEFEIVYAQFVRPHLSCEQRIKEDCEKAIKVLRSL